MYQFEKNGVGGMEGRGGGSRGVNNCEPLYICEKPFGLPPQITDFLKPSSSKALSVVLGSPPPTISASSDHAAPLMKYKASSSKYWTVSIDHPPTRFSHTPNAPNRLFTSYRLGALPVCAACLAFIFLNASSPLAPSGLENTPPSTRVLRGTIL